MLFNSNLPTVALLSKLESVLSHSATVLSTKFTSYSESLFCYSNNLHGIFTKSEFHFKKHFLSSSVRINFSSFKVLSWDCNNSVISLSSCLLLNLCHIWSYFFHWSLEPLEVIHEDQNKFFLNSYEYWYFISFHES